MLEANFTYASKGEEPNRLLVVLSVHPEGTRVLRTAKRKANSLNISWEVVIIDTPGKRNRMDHEDLEHQLHLMTLAEQMGAYITTIQAKHVAEGVYRVIQERQKSGIHIAVVIVGTPLDRSFWISLHPTLYKRLTSDKRITTPVISVPLGSHLSQSKIAQHLKITTREVIYSLIAVAVATLVVELINHFWPQAVLASQQRNKAIIYMTACAFSASRYGMLAGIICAVVSFLVMSVLYISPYFKVIISTPADAANLLIFLASASLISLFGSTEHRIRESVTQRAERFQSLVKVHRVTLNRRSREEAIQTLDEELTKVLGTQIALFLPQAKNPELLKMVFVDHAELSAQDQQALYQCWEECVTTGAGSPYVSNSNWRFEPMLTAMGEIGVLGALITPKVTLDSSFGRLMSSISDQAALILERMEIGHLAEETRVQAEKEKLRSMLLSSVSHDLKTPLASVIGSLSVYRSMEQVLPADHKTTLINTALEEAQRLDSFITNILDITRIETGQIEMKHEWVRPDILLKEVTKRLRERIRNHPISIFPPEGDAIEVQMDSMMTGQVFQNVIDNAGKYTVPGTPIHISWKANEEGFTLQIRDFGPGIPEDKLEKIFDKYARINQQDSKVAGTGLGLAIAKFTMEAQKGYIKVHNHPEGGAVFTIFLPRWRNVNGEDKKVA